MKIILIAISTCIVNVLITQLSTYYSPLKFKRVSKLPQGMPTRYFYQKKYKNFEACLEVFKSGLSRKNSSKTIL